MAGFHVRIALPSRIGAPSDQDDPPRADALVLPRDRAWRVTGTRRVLSACGERGIKPGRIREISDSKQSAEDLAVLRKLNDDYIHSDQFNDVERFREFLADDFLIQIEGATLERAEYLEYIAKPRPFKDLAVHDVNIRILTDDVALIHARVTLTTLADGVAKQALYTDTYQKRDGTWVCVAACAPDPLPVA
jgi:hypothetical protein